MNASWIMKEISLGFLIIILSAVSYILITYRAKGLKLTGFILFILVPILSGFLTFTGYNDVLKAYGLMNNEGVITATGGGGYRIVDWSYYWKAYEGAQPQYHAKSIPDQRIPTEKENIEIRRGFFIFAVGIVPFLFIWLSISKGRGKLPKLLLSIVGLGVSVVISAFACSQLSPDSSFPIWISILLLIVFSNMTWVMFYLTCHAISDILSLAD